MNLIFETPGDEWDRAVAVTCVECPKCAFTFDATHEDEDGGYSCPQCDQLALQAENERLREALRENVGEAYNLITQGESPTQRRQPSAQRIYDRSKEALAQTKEADHA